MAFTITPSAATDGENVLADIINTSWSTGATIANSYSASVETAKTSFLDSAAVADITADTVTVPTIAEPAVDIPSSTNATDVMSMFDTKYLELVALLSDKFATFKSTYYPDDSALLASVSGRMSELSAVTIPMVTGGAVSAPTITDTVSSADIVSNAVFAQPVLEPALAIPASVDTSAILGVFDSAYADLVALLQTKFVEYRATYFANEGGVYDSAEDWLLAALANSSAALPVPVAEQIWGDDQARILSDKVRAQDAVVAQFAARRFPLPPDVAASMVLQIEQKAQDELAESSRKVAVMSVELMQKTLERALQLRVTTMQAANEYIKSLASAPDIASRIVGIGYDAQSKLISSVAALLGARTEVAKLALQADTTSANMAFEAEKLNQAVSLDAAKANLGVSVEKAKLGLQASTTTVQIAFEAAKSNQMAALESVKLAVTNVIDLRTKSMASAVEYVKALASGPEMASRLVGIGYDAQSKLISSAAQFYNARTQAKEAVAKVQQFNVTADIERQVKNQAVDLALVESKLKALLSEAQGIAQMATALFNNLQAQASASNNFSKQYQYSGEVSGKVAPA